MGYLGRLVISRPVRLGELLSKDTGGHDFERADNL